MPLIWAFKSWRSWQGKCATKAWPSICKGCTKFLEGEEIRQSGWRNFLGFPKRWNGGVGGRGDKEMEEGCI